MTRTANDRTEHFADNTDKGAISGHPGNPEMVSFGRWEGGRFVVSYAQPARGYKTAAGADRAIRRWLSVA